MRRVLRYIFLDDTNYLRTIWVAILGGIVVALVFMAEFKIAEMIRDFNKIIY